MAGAVIHIGRVREFAEKCNRAGVQVPPSIARGLALVDAANEYAKDPPLPDMLGLSVDEIRKLVPALSIRFHVGRRDYEPAGLEAGASAIGDKIAREIRERLLPELDVMARELRPRFEKLAAPVVTAAKRHGIAADTPAERILEMDDPAVTKAWREAHEALPKVNQLADFYISAFKAFDLPPLGTDVDDLSRGPNWSVLFAAGSNWSSERDVYVIPGRGLDWFAIAPGGLTLRAPSDVLAEMKRLSSGRARVSIQKQIDAAEAKRQAKAQDREKVAAIDAQTDEETVKKRSRWGAAREARKAAEAG